MKNLPGFTVLLWTLIGLSAGDDSKLIVNINNDGNYSIAAGGNHDFNITSGDAFLQSNGMLHTTANMSLKLTAQAPQSGVDQNGMYKGKMFQYAAGNNMVVQYHVLVYNDGEFVRFKQFFPRQVARSNVSSHDDVLSGFPNFKTKNFTDQIGYLNMFDFMCGYRYRIANFSGSGKTLLSGQRAGPLVLFDQMGNTMVVSAFSNFMAHNMMFNETSMQLHFGIMGGVTSVPMNYEIDTIVYFGNNGINQAIEGWGAVLAKRYGKTSAYRDNDFTIKYLGYWTDNGAFYYYNKEDNRTYEDTMLDVVKYATTAGIPYRYIQYDSWWYYKGIDDGVKNWTAMPSVFPNGLGYLYQKHGMPVSAHNRYWASNTDYAKDNGGQYGFVVEEKKSMPHDNKFWVDLLHNSTSWGLIMYEQDWLDREFEGMTATHTDINLGRDWLMQMGRGAEDNDMTVQYCMTLSRHMLQSIEIPVVTQSRVSDDYQPGNDQWRIGITSMFANALHLAPFKDTFWTTSYQKGSEYSNNETYPALQAAIATLSTGPVGPSDSIGNTAGLIHSSCNSDGLLLKPSRPITTTDQHIMNLAFPAKAKAGSPTDVSEVFSTYADISYSSYTGRHGLILMTDLTTGFAVFPEMMYLDTEKTYIAYNGHPSTDLNVYVVGGKQSHTVPKCGRSDFQLWFFAPTFNLQGVRTAVLGERNKWVPVSPQRTKYIEVRNSNDLHVHVEGVPGEHIQYGFYTDDQFDDNVLYANCNFGNSGNMVIKYPSLTCMNV